MQLSYKWLVWSALLISLFAYFSSTKTNFGHYHRHFKKRALKFDFNVGTQNRDLEGFKTDGQSWRTLVKSNSAQCTKGRHTLLEIQNRRGHITFVNSKRMCCPYTRAIEKLRTSFFVLKVQIVFQQKRRFPLYLQG